MIDVFDIAGAATGIVNPQIEAVLKVSDGVTQNPDFSTTPKIIELAMQIEVQALSSSDLQQIQSINQGSDMRAIYIIGGIKGLNRPLQCGGDIINFYGSDWLVTQSLEEWGMGEWSKVAVTRQTTPTQPRPLC